MKRIWSILLAAALVTGCSKAKPSAAPPADPAPQPVETAKPPTPEPATPVSGPIYVLSQPEKPLWPGPASSIIENSPQARPQAGLNDADLVVEALSESEITRTLALFWSHPVEKIGPVRSARTGFVSVAFAYEAPFAHAGGNDDALAVLRQSGGPRNLDEIYGSGGYFWRSTDRQMPHNLYTNTKLLGAAITDRKLGLAPVPTTPKHENTPPETDLVKRVDITWHRLHHVSWVWDGKAYGRLEENAPHKLENGDQIATPNLVFLNVQGVNNGPDLGWALEMEKGGKATVVSGGRTWEGKWSLSKGGFSLQPAEGKALPFLPGNVWVELITQESSFSLAR